MKIRELITLQSGRYHVQVELYDLSSSITRRFKQFGTQSLQIGGEVNDSITRPGDSVPTVVELQLTEQEQKVDGPITVKRVFDTRDSADADVYAKAWSSLIKQRMETLITELMQKPVHFVGETVTTFGND